MSSARTFLQRHDGDLNLWAPNALACAPALLSTARCHRLLVVVAAENMRGPTWWTSSAHGTLSPRAQAQVFAKARAGEEERPRYRAGPRIPNYVQRRQCEALEGLSEISWQRLKH